jgi:sterol 3beta-glucosyltransferase
MNADSTFWPSRGCSPTAHDPALEDNSDSDEDSDPTPSTPTDSSHDDILAAQPSHHFSPEKEAAIPFPDRTRPVRGGSIVLEERKSAILTRNLANQLALDRMDDADASIKRAQEDASTDDEVEDKSTEGTDQPAARLATLVHEFGPWTGEGTEEWLIQIPGALFRGVLIKGR